MSVTLYKEASTYWRQWKRKTCPHPKQLRWNNTMPKNTQWGAEVGEFYQRLTFRQRTIAITHANKHQICLQPPSSVWLSSHVCIFKGYVSQIQTLRWFPELTAAFVSSDCVKVKAKQPKSDLERVNLNLCKWGVFSSCHADTFKNAPCTI